MFHKARGRVEYQRMESYRQTQPAVGVSLERLTKDVPGDGYYYVLVKGEIKGRHRTLKRAQAQYKELIAASGWRPEPATRSAVDPAREAVDRYLDELGAYWSSAHQHRRRGGKTMYRR